MYYYPYSRQEEQDYVIDTKSGDVNGDNVIDNVYLVRKKGTWRIGYKRY